MAECQFASTYHDYELGERPVFKCHEEALDGGFCIFHDSNYLQDYLFSFREEKKRNVREKLMDKVTDSIHDYKALFCIGYYLPDIKIEVDFTKPVYFLYASFQQADFSGAKFSAEVDFREAKFSGGAKFSEAEFSGGASFYSAEFSGGASFYSAEFSGGAKFSEAEFSRVVDFSEAEFSRVVDFNSAKFSGGANFSASKFKEGGNADFVGANFKRADFVGANFEGISNNFAVANFEGEANFSRANFKEGAYFYRANFKGKANFSRAAFFDRTYFSGNFNAQTRFNHVLFEGKEKIDFDVENLSKVSFMNTDITRVRFSDRARWGQKDRFKVIEEEMLEESPQQVSLGSVMAVYRNLRENYEYRLRYDEAGKFFIKEMELKRRYREEEEKNTSRSGNDAGGSSSSKTVPNCWLRRNLSLTGLYYHLSRYGEDLLRPTLVGIVIVFLSTLFWLMQSKPTLEPHFFINSSLYNSTSHFVYLNQAGNLTQWQKAFERSLSDLIPLLPSGSRVEIGLLDYVIKIAGGALTFGLIAIALRRKFERKYTR